jgi:O-antigen biosynthesis protein
LLEAFNVLDASNRLQFFRIHSRERVFSAAMLEAVNPYAGVKFDTPQFQQLAPDVFLVVWDPPHPVNASPRLEEQTGLRFSSLASVRLARLDGGSRLVWIFCVKDRPALTLRLYAGAVGSGADLNVKADLKPGPADPFALTFGLSQNACAVLVTTVLNTWSGVFKLEQSRGFIHFATELLRSVNDAPSIVDCVAAIGEIRIFETVLNAECEEISSVVLVSNLGLKRLSGQFCNVANNSGKSRLFLGSAVLKQLPDKGFLVLSGPWGLAIRRLSSDSAGRSLNQWWAANPRKLPEVRDFLISEIGERSAPARAAVLDLQVSDPIPARRHGVLGETTSFCAIEVALTSADGVLVGGWLRDPAGMYDRIDVLDAAGNQLPLNLHCFEGVLPEAQGGFRIKRFVAFVPVSKALNHHLQPRFELRLASGDRELLIPPPQPSDLGGMRAKALSVIPPRNATDDIISECLHIPFSGIQQRLGQSVGSSSEILFGTPSQQPVVSIIIPLYRVLEFLKAQLAAFSTDRWLAANAEVIFVLDSPEQAEHLEDLLSGLHLLYELPVRLIVMPRNSGYALACNTGASKARGRHLAMINSDVVPLNPGWLEKLTACLMMDEHVGAVGPKLLYADNAVQHAGLKFIQDDKGRWFNHHYCKGFPRRFAQASASREVPGVTGACLVLSRADFEEVGGFSPDYIIGDYEDSDLCLKLRRLSRRIYYLGGVELYHFERVSIKGNADYTRGTASQYNRWLHETRWRDDMAELMDSIGDYDRRGAA